MELWCRLCNDVQIPLQESAIVVFDITNWASLTPPSYPPTHLYKILTAVLTTQHSNKEPKTLTNPLYIELFHLHLLYISFRNTIHISSSKHLVLGTSPSNHKMSAQVDAAEEDVNTKPASSYIVFGEIAHPIAPGPFNRASIFQHCKSNSYSRATRPINTKAARKHTGSGKPSSLRAPKISLPVNTKPASITRDTWTAVSNWLATSQTFEKPQEPVEEPPTPTSPEDPAPWKRLHQEHWFQISKSLDLRLKARSGQSKASVPSVSGPGSAHRSTKGRICDGLLESSELARAEKHSLRDGTHAFSSPVAQGLPPEEARENDRSVEILDTSCLQEKPGRHSPAQESLGAVSMNETAEVTSKQAERRKSTRRV